MAEKTTGVWWGSAKALSALCGGSLSQRNARKVLETLGFKGYVRRLTKPGGHSNYPILIDKYECTYGASKGKRLNAEKSTSLEHLVYENAQDDVKESVKQEHVKDGASRNLAISAIQSTPSLAGMSNYVNGDGEDRASIQEERSKKKTNKNSEAPSGARLAGDHAFQAFQRKFGQPPAWDKTHYIQVSALFQRVKTLSQEEFNRRWDYYLASEDPFVKKNGYSLRYFCSAFDGFMHGPINEKGKPVASAPILTGKDDPKTQLTDRGKKIMEHFSHAA